MLAAVVGLVVALELPTYQEYILRANVFELLRGLDCGKVALVEYIETCHVMPHEAPVTVTSTSTRYVVSSDYVRGGDDMRASFLRLPTATQI